MKKTALLLPLALAFYGCNQTKPSAEVQATTQELQTDDLAYGAIFSEAEVMPVSSLSTALEGRESLQVTVAAEIVESCQAKGCWMDVKLTDSSNMKVTFKDYAFFLPVEDLKGRQVVFFGKAKREVISVEDQRHYAKDAGKPEAEILAITAPKEELRFVAEGVKLK